MVFTPTHPEVAALLVSMRHPRAWPFGAPRREPHFLISAGVLTRLVHAHRRKLEARKEASFSTSRVESDRTWAGPDILRIFRRVAREFGRQKLGRRMPE